ncbi:MAG: NAD-dependent epimerase/dehydratase family protein [Myxococcota bacterium]
MKLFITGGTGYLGRHLIPRLARDGHELTVLSRDPARVIDGAQTAPGDILTPETLGPAMAGADALIHAAGKVSHDLDDAEEMWRLHVTGTENILDAAEAAGVKRVVYLSTSGTVAVSDDPDFLGTENSPDPLRFVRSWPYYRSKLFAEQIALKRSAPAFKVICLNPSLLLGPGDDAEGNSTVSIRRFLDGQVPACPPGGLSFVDVRDVADAVAVSLTKGRAGKRYLLSGGNMTFRQFYNRLARIADKPAPMVNMPSVTRKALSWIPGFDQITAFVGAELSKEEMELACHYWYADPSRAEDVLGWTGRDPQRTLEDTVHDIQQREGQRFAPWVS